jgi:hypothetical protein
LSIAAAALTKLITHRPQAYHFPTGNGMLERRCHFLIQLSLCQEMALSMSPLARRQGTSPIAAANDDIIFVYLSTATSILEDDV